VASEWYVSINGETKGPLSSSELKRWLNEGKIARDTFVRDGSNGPWKAVGKVPLPADSRKAASSLNVLALSAAGVLGLEIILLLRTDPLTAKLALVPLGAYLAAVLLFWQKRDAKKAG
jgi:hypothetical protein